MNWFTSDTHFNDPTVIEYASRPFRNVSEMNRGVIERWNATVRSGDTVYHLGDFACGREPEWPDLLKSLHGRKILIRGNHDATRVKMLACGFDEVPEPNVVVNVDGVQVWMNHYAPCGNDEWDFRRPEAPGEYDVAICGHVHGRWRVKSGIVNVGVDVWGFRPISLDQIFQTLAKGS